MRRKPKPTLAGVAGIAEVSLGTASMILNGGKEESFSPETVARVREAAEAAGYSVRSRSPCSGGLVAVLCPNISNPYYASLVQAIEQAAGESGYGVIILNSYRSPEAEAGNVAAAVAAKACGLVFAMPPLVPDPKALLGRIPAVAIGDRGCAPAIDSVEIDNYGAGRLLGTHLAGLGHRRIAYLSTTLDDANNMRIRRLRGLQDGFLSACPEGSVIVRSRKVSPKDEILNLYIEHEVGFDLGAECFASEGPTALACINDMVAYGAIDALLDRGLDVPRDCSVCGFDDIFPSRLEPIALTSVDHFIVEKGRSAFHMLKARMRPEHRAHGPDAITRVEYKPRLVIRASTGAPRPGA